MAVYRRTKDGKPISKFYWMRFNYNGTEYRESTKCTNRRDAEEFEREFRTNLKRGELGLANLKRKNVKIPTFAAAIAEFLETAPMKDSTRTRYRAASRALIEHFGKTLVTQITHADVEDFRNKRSKAKKLPPALLKKKRPSSKTSKTIKPATVNREVMVLSAVYSWLLRRKTVSENPAKGVKLLQENNEQERIVSPEEFNRYLLAAGQPLRDVAVIMYDTGMRPEEIVRLTKQQMDFENAKIRIFHGKSKAAKRNIPMSPRVREILEARFRSAPGAYLFPSGRDGKGEGHITKINATHNRAVRRAGIEPPFTPYALRHTWATRAVEAGVDLVTVAAIMGHARLNILTRYTHTSDVHKEEAINRLYSQSEEAVPAKVLRIGSR